MRFVIWAAIAAACAAAPLSARAQEPLDAEYLTHGPRTGFYVGAACDVRWITGSGTWSTYDFDVDQYLSVDGGGPVGLAWRDHFLLGLQPSLGYRLSRAFALQAGLAVHIPKSSKQSTYESTTNYYYEQGMTIDWHQRVIEVLAIWRPDEDGRFYLQAGVEWHAVTVDVLLWEGVQINDDLGTLVGLEDYRDQSSKTDAAGFVVGGGMEWVSESGRREVFVAAQYSTARTDGALFGTEDFKVDIGGISATAGLRFHLF